MTLFLFWKKTLNLLRIKERGADFVVVVFVVVVAVFAVIVVVIVLIIVAVVKLTIGICNDTSIYVYTS